MVLQAVTESAHLPRVPEVCGDGAPGGRGIFTLADCRADRRSYEEGVTGAWPVADAPFPRIETGRRVRNAGSPDRASARRAIEPNALRPVGRRPRHGRLRQGLRSRRRAGDLPAAGARPEAEAGVGVVGDPGGRRAAVRRPRARRPPGSPTTPTPASASGRAPTAGRPPARRRLRRPWRRRPRRGRRPTGRSAFGSMALLAEALSGEPAFRTLRPVSTRGNGASATGQAPVTPSSYDLRGGAAVCKCEDSATARGSVCLLYTSPS